MTYFVRAPGTCGEFIQGSVDGQPFLVTCPINRYSYALSEVIHPLPHHYCSLQPKAARARQATLSLFRKDPYEEPPVYVRSDILQGKGMASSSADIAVTVMATALAVDCKISLSDLADICLSVEPTDASFYPGITQFDYMRGTLCEPLGFCPPMTILIFDEGGEIDTVAFNEKHDLQEKIREKEPIIKDALALFREGLTTHDISLIGEAATMSAFGNQRILYKNDLYDFHDIGIHFHSVGTITAHSGTIMGLLFPSDYGGIDDCRKTIEQSLPNLHYVDTVETTNEGLTYIKR